MARRSDVMETIVSLSKRRGLVFPSSEIYGGLRASWDYGPLGVELKNNVKRQWWKSMVQGRDDVVGLDSCVILAREVWEASGHVRGVRRPADRVPVVPQAATAPTTSKRRTRRSTARRRRTAWPTWSARTAAPAARSPSRRCSTGCSRPTSARSRTSPAWPTCGPETAQGIFINYADVQQAARRKPPFGIGQIGKSFRNEITPGNFIFRTREFEQMEMEFFVEPGTDEEWHQYWIDTRFQWYVDLGIAKDNLRLYEHPKEKLSHYAKRTVDVEYRFDFPGSEWGELEGIANRTNYDLSTHGKHSGQDLSYFDQEKNERYVP